jgi:pyruvate formate-lyase activating enzyme-like uncharacterized protein
VKISKQDALQWFTFFAQLPEGEELMPRQTEIVYAVLTQIERAVDAENARLMADIPALKSLAGRTNYVGNDGKFPKGCKSCLFGTGLGAVRKTNRCNAACRFCYDFGQLDAIPPIGEGMWEIGGTKFREEDMELLLSVQKKPSGIAYVYLEPFMEIEVYYGIIRRFHDAGIYQHLYTNGIAANEENLRALGACGLNEIRFNLGATNCADAVIDKIAVAKRYIPMVGIETPMTESFAESFRKKKEKILATGLDFINCAELHLNENNIGNYLGEPMYMCRRGYVSPISSRRIALQLMRQAHDEGWDICVHDCSNMTKFARDLNLAAKEGKWFGASAYGCEFETIPYEAFLPTLQDESFHFVEEEPLPEGYRVGDIAF